jgi:hypothetical protein
MQVFCSFQFWSMLFAIFAAIASTDAPSAFASTAPVRRISIQTTLLARAEYRPAKVGEIVNQ